MSKRIKGITLVIMVTVFLTTLVTTIQAKKTVTFWSYKEPDIINEIAAKFMAEHPDIKIEFTKYDTDVGGPFAAALVAHEVADVFSCDMPGPILLLYKGGYIEDLTRYYEKYPSFKNNIPEGLIDKYKIDGRFYAWIGGVNCGGNHYNLNVLSKLGADIPETWDEYTQIATKAKAQDIVPFATSAKPSWPLQWIISSLLQIREGSDFVAALGKNKRRWDSKEITGAFKMIQEMTRENWFPKGFLGITEEEARVLWYTDKALTYEHGPWIPMLVFREKAPASFDYEFAGGWPRFKEDIDSQPLAMGGGYAMNSYSKVKDETAMWFEYFLRPENQAIFVEKEQSVVPIKGAMTPANSTPKMRKYAEVLEASSDPCELLGVTLHPEISLALRKSLESLMALILTPEEATKQVQVAQDRILQEE